MMARTLEWFRNTVATAAEEQDPVQLDAAASAWDQLTAHPDWPSLPRSERLAAFDDAGVAFAARYRASGQMADLERAITIYEAALAEVPSTEPDHPVLLTSLANRLRERYARHGTREDLERIVTLSEAAVAETPPGAPQRAARLSNAGGALRARFVVEGHLHDLERAIDAFQQARDSDPAIAADRATYDNNLAVALSDRYEHTGRVDDLDAAVAASERAVQASPPGSPDLTMYRANLAIHLSSRYDLHGDLGDLDRAIAELEQAADGAEPDAPDLPSLFGNQAALLLDRYERTGQPDDLEMSLQAAEAAVALAGAGSPDLPGHLNNLGNARRLRFEHGTTSALDSGTAAAGLEVTDLLLAVEAYRRAVELTPPDSPNRPKFLTNFGNGLLDRSLAQARVDDLDEAVGALEEAVTATPPGSPDLPGRQNNLATGLRARHGRNGDPADLRRALDTYRASCLQGLEAYTEIALAAAGNWGDWASQRRSWPEATEAYGLGLRAAAQLYRLQPLRDYKQTWLRASKGLAARTAYAWAMRDGAEQAVLAQEMGRALLLSEALERGRANLEDLDARAPLLAGRYRKAVQRLTILEGVEMPSPSGHLVEPLARPIKG
jgi:tetratricopeptide (TPR) repeat protein